MPSVWIGRSRRRAVALALLFLPGLAIPCQPARAFDPSRGETIRLLAPSERSHPGHGFRPALPPALKPDLGRTTSPSPEETGCTPAQAAPFGATGTEERLSQLQQSVAALAGGGVGVVWTEGAYPTPRDVRMQWLDRDGHPLYAGSGALIGGFPSDEWGPVIVAHPSSGAFIAFVRGNSIMVQYVDASRAPRWAIGGVSVVDTPPAGGYLSEPNLLADPDGGVFACFQLADATTGYDIRCQRFDSTGTRLWPGAGVSATSGGSADWRVLPRTVSDGAGGLLVFFRNQGTSNAPSAPMLMEGQRLTGQGQKPWGVQPRVVRTTNLARDNGYSYTFFQVASDGEGGAVLAFNDWTQLSDDAMDVVAQRVSSAGDLLWGDGAVVTAAAGHQQHEQTIGTGEGGVIVAVYEGHGSTHSKLFLHRLGPDGQNVWDPAGVLLSEPSATALDYSVRGSFHDGLLRLAHTHQVYPATFEMDVRLATYSGDGVRMSTGWLTQASDAQFLQDFVFSPSFGGVLGVWDDRGKGTWSDVDVRGAFLEEEKTAPSVTPPPGIVVRQSLCSLGFAGAHAGATPASLRLRDAADGSRLDTFLLGGAASDDCTAVPARLAPRLSDAEITDATFFPAGPSTVTFSFRDAAGNLGAATSTVTVRRQGDIDLDGDADILDNLIVASYIVGNVLAEAVPFRAPLSAADADEDGDVDLFDILVHQGFIVGNVSCLTP